MPAWSPDGQRIAYTSVRDGNYDIWVMSAAGEDQKRLTDYGGVDNLPSWSPDGRWIAYHSTRDDGSHIWRVLATGGEPEQMTERSGRLPRWAPDGESVYFRGGDDYWAVSVQDHAERLVADLSEKPGNQGGYALASDGDYLYFTWEETLGDIWVMDFVWVE